MPQLNAPAMPPLLKTNNFASLYLKYLLYARAIDTHINPILPFLAIGRTKEQENEASEKIPEIKSGFGVMMQETSGSGTHKIDINAKITEKALIDLYITSDFPPSMELPDHVTSPGFAAKPKKAVPKKSPAKKKAASRKSKQRFISSSILNH